MQSPLVNFHGNMWATCRSSGMWCLRMLCLIIIVLPPYTMVKLIIMFGNIYHSKTPHPHTPHPQTPHP